MKSSSLFQSNEATLRHLFAFFRVNERNGDVTPISFALVLKSLANTMKNLSMLTVPTALGGV
jgi:hypothetical protein